MKISEVAKLDPLQILLYWCRERQSIYLKRRAGEPKPWTDDEILQQYYFTNVFREQDKTTVWFRENVRGPMRDDPRVIFATICFRWFNLISTGDILKTNRLLEAWDERVAVDLLDSYRQRGTKLFTGAFMINSPAGEPKLEAICRRITRVWEQREGIPRNWEKLQHAHNYLTRFEGLGGFMAYEVVTDLRWTSALCAASDIMTWSNPGPGAIRGLYRVLGRPLGIVGNATAPPVPKDWAPRTAEILEKMQSALSDMNCEFPIEMHEVEMVLCETDKFIRLLRGEGKSKRNYQGAR